MSRPWRQARPLLIVMLSLLLAEAAHARMYQWTAPATGRTQLSGLPPSWYRAGDETGPRVFVFENGQLIDDTAIRVPDIQRVELRREAFGVATASPPAPATTPTAGEAVSEPATALPEPLEVSPPEPAVTESAPVSAEAEQAARLKALIEAWDAGRTDRARSVLESLYP